MGHKEDLLAAAKRCLYEKGYARTTARDLVAASGTNLASIGYHYGSKDNLMNQAMLSATEDWSDELGQVLSGVELPPERLSERFELIWTLILQTFERHRPLWVATFEIFSQAEHIPEVRTLLAEKIQNAREGVTALFTGLAEPVDPALARPLGGFYYALISGVISQWLLDPAQAPTPQDLTRALELIHQGFAAPTLAPSWNS